MPVLPLRPLLPAALGDYRSKARRGEPWIDSGNVIVVSQSGDKAWRVDEGTLSEGSEYFKNLIASGNRNIIGVDRSHIAESCKVICIGKDTETTTEDTEEALKLIYGKVAMPINSLSDADSFERLLDFLELAATYGLWTLFFATLRIFLADYRERLAMFSNWDGMRDIAIPRNAIHMLNVVYTSQSLLEHYAVDTAAERDPEVLAAMEVMKAGCRLDLSLFVADEELRSAPMPDPDLAAYEQSPSVLSPEDKALTRNIRDFNYVHAVALKDILASFSVLVESKSNDHLPCCSQDVTSMCRRLWAVNTRRGTRFSGTLLLDFIRGLHTDSGRADICENCLEDLDSMLVKVYRSWWMAVSPYIRGIKNFEGP